MATCKDCIHCEACERMISDTSKMFKVLLSEILKMNCDIKYDSTNILSGAEICQCFQDRSRFVELPCKVGDTIYSIENGYIKNDSVTNIVYYANINEFVIQAHFTCFNEKAFGKTVFLTREEAEAAMKKQNYEEES